MRRAAGLLVILWLAAVSGSLLGAELRPAAIESFHVDPGVPAVLRWRATDVEAKTLPYLVRDYVGKTVAEGEAKPGGEFLEIELTLPAGFYDVEFPAAGRRFGILSATSGAEPDPFFSIDSALSWLVDDEATREGLIRALARSGIAMSRERLGWGQIQPAAGRWEWDTPRRYESVRKFYAGQHVEMLEMCHDAPGWMGRVGKYPDDLVAAAKAWREITARWKDYCSALEVWNEPDIFFGDNLPADQYVALVKAVSFGAAADGGPLMVGGVVAHHNREFLSNAARNGLLDCAAVFSFHTYGRAEEMESLVADYRTWLADHGKPSVPLWLTECGRPWKKGPPRPPVDEDSTSALDIAMKAVEAKCCGVARYFAFVYPFYEENDNNFGMTGREGTPLRSMAAYTAAARRLASRRYLGDFQTDDPAVRRARVFGQAASTATDEDEVVLVLYTGKVDAARTVALGIPILRIEGIDGRELKSSDGVIPVPDGLSYVWLDRVALASRLRPDTPAAKLRDAGQPAPEVARRGASPIVLRYQFDPKLVSAISEGYRVTTEALEAFPVRVRSFNLAPETQKLTLEVGFSAPEVKLAGAAAREIEVPGESFVDVDWIANLSGGFAADDRLTAIVAAESDTGEAVLPLAIDLLGEATVAQRVSRYARTVRLPIEDLTAWKPQIAGGGKLEMDSPSSGGWRMSARFAPGDRWAYPQLPLSEGLDLREFEALVVRVRCPSEATLQAFLWEPAGVGYITGRPLAPADGRWHTVLVRFGDFVVSPANAPDPNSRLDLDRVQMLSIGFNSQIDCNELELSDAWLVGGKK